MVVLSHVGSPGRCVRGITSKIAMATGNPNPVSVVDAHQLAVVVRNRIENVLIIDSRSFIEHNSCHVATAVNVCCSKIVKRRLQQDKLSVKELLVHTCHCDVEDGYDVVVYDQQTKDVESISADSFISVLLKKLQLVFRSVNLLSGGFLEFQACYPDLCEDKTRKCPPLSSLSQPCLSVDNQGPTRILPFMYLGSQYDAMNTELLKDYNITYELNVSTTCPQPDFVPEGHFMRIPVNDNYSEKLLPHFPRAFNFLDKVREGNGCVLVHCLAGISRSPTVAIAYVMRYLRLSSDDGYRYVKSKRPTISPNFNFLGQLLEYEKQLRQEKILDAKLEATSAPPICAKKRLCCRDMRTPKLSLNIDMNNSSNSSVFPAPRNGDQSPTTALAKLSFAGPPTPESPSVSDKNPLCWPDFRQYRSKSCYGDWLRDREDSTVEHRAIKESLANASSGKTLSPVKEIKCEALISEISHGNKETSITSVADSSFNRTVTSRKCSQERPNVFSFSSEVQSSEENSVWTTEKFSVQTLSHVQCDSYKLNYVPMGCSNNVQQQGKTSPHVVIDTVWPSTRMDEFPSKVVHKESTPKTKISPVMLRKASKEHHTKKEVVTHSDNQQYLNPFCVNSETYKRSDSATTSGFGSESSDCTDICGGHLGSSHLEELDVEDLDDDVILRNSPREPKEARGGNRGSDYFSLNLPETACRPWSHGLESPLSPSERHLLEDLDVDRDDIRETGDASPCGSDTHSDDPDSFHDSGVPSSPPWPWSRKRMAPFDEAGLSLSHQKNHSSERPKGVYKLEDARISLQSETKDTWSSREKALLKAPDGQILSQNQPVSSTHYSSVGFECSSGLYRVHSCPGILTEISSYSLSEENCRMREVFPRSKRKLKDSGSASEKLCFQRYSMTSADLVGFKTTLASHESCPDLEGHNDSLPQMSSSHHERDYRRNSRMIQVS